MVIFIVSFPKIPPKYHIPGGPKNASKSNSYNFTKFCAVHLKLRQGMEMSSKFKNIKGF